MTALRQRMIEDLKIRNRSPRTISTYIACVTNFARHFRNSPAVLGPEEIRQYQVYLVRERKVSWSYFNQVVSALRFLYRVTLGREWTISHIPYPRQPRKLPLILSPAEVQRFFATIKQLKYRAILMTAYAAGLRLSEVTHLRVADIDSQRMFGLLSNRARATKLARCRQLLSAAPETLAICAHQHDAHALFQTLAGDSLTRCPACQQGQLRRLETIGPFFQLPSMLTAPGRPIRLDSS